MPDGRFLAKSISHNQELASVSIEAALLFTWCIPHLDREGRMPGHPALVKSIACPMRPEITVESVPELLRSLGGRGLIRWYEVDGKQVLEFPGFKNHQRGARLDREAASRLPSSTCKGARDLLRTGSGPTPEEVGVSEVKRSEVEVKRSEVKTPPPAAAAIAPTPARAPEASPPPSGDDDGDDDSDGGDQEKVISSIIRAANRGMAKNPQIAENLTPIHFSHASRQAVAEWIEAGVPPSLAKRVVYERALAWQPDGRHRQITSMAYFTEPVMEEFDRRKATNGAAPSAPTKRRRARRAPGETPQKYDYSDATKEWDGTWAK